MILFSDTYIQGEGYSVLTASKLFLNKRWIFQPYQHIFIRSQRQNSRLKPKVHQLWLFIFWFITSSKTDYLLGFAKTFQ